MSPAALVSIIGPVGVGKTTLARLLAADLPARLIEEDYRGNPFLAEAYTGLAAARLPAQTFFLLSRAAQLDRRRLAGLAVSDYAFVQDAVFARRNLNETDLRFYRRLARAASRHVQPPDVLIHLDASERTLLGRVADRGRDFERRFDEPFLAYLRRQYRQAIRRARCPVLTVDCEQADVRDGPQRRRLIRQVKEALRGAGVRHADA